MAKPAHWNSRRSSAAADQAGSNWTTSRFPPRRFLSESAGFDRNWRTAVRAVAAFRAETAMKFHIAIFAAAFSCSVSGQSTFQNLDFESADLPPISAGQYGWGVSIASALPGWSASINGVPVTQVFQNNYTLGEASIDILGPNWNSVDPGIIDGDYTVFLRSVQYGSRQCLNLADGTVPAKAGIASV